VDRYGFIIKLDADLKSVYYCEADHIVPHDKGGETISANCQMIHWKMNRLKSDHVVRAEVDRYINRWKTLVIEGRYGVLAPK
jgi:5-methylcytosine-specific restriction endonuclease McrA